MAADCSAGWADWSARSSACRAGRPAAIVSPGRGYLVGERGPELFVPTSAGRVESNAAARGGAREVRVSINVVTPQGSSAPQAMQRSSRQVASAVRRALTSS